jgi:hypothetical protein
MRWPKKATSKALLARLKKEYAGPFVVKSARVSYLKYCVKKS